MCIYWVKHFSCNHFADFSQPTLLSHCRDYDVVLRYWQDQVYYRPLEETNSEMGPIRMPQPCRPIWPIRFPGDRYLPLPNEGSEHPRGLARPRPIDTGYFELTSQQQETLRQRLIRENYLMDTIGDFETVAAFQQVLDQRSTVDVADMCQHSFPNGHFPYQKPPYPRAYIDAILLFAFRHNSPHLAPNVIIHRLPTPCLRTYSPHCNHAPTNLRELQCPWLLSQRTAWQYPPTTSPPGIGVGIPYPEQLARSLADFDRRGGAVSNHMRKDAVRSELIRVGVTRSGALERIPDLLYSRMQVTVPCGPLRHVVPPPFCGIAAQTSVPVVGQVMAQPPSSQPAQQQQQQQHRQQQQPQQLQQQQQPVLAASSPIAHLGPFIIGPATPPATLSPPGSSQAQNTDAASDKSASSQQDHPVVVEAAESDQLGH